MDNFVNMTGSHKFGLHDVNIMIDGEIVATIPSSGTTLRVPDPKVDVIGELTIGEVTVRVNRKNYEGLTAMVVDADGNETALPEPVEGTWYIVSIMAASSLSDERSDLLVTDEQVRDGSTVLGCGCLGTLSPTLTL